MSIHKSTTGEEKLPALGSRHTILGSESTLERILAIKLCKVRGKARVSHIKLENTPIANFKQLLEER